MRASSQTGSLPVLACYFAATLVVFGIVAFRARSAVVAGFPDFATFYTAARITHEGHAARLYDEAEQRSIQGDFAAPVLSARGDILPYIHPPFEALLFLPLASFSYRTAYVIWLAINFTLVLSLPFLLRQHLPHLADIPVVYWHLGLFSFFPVFMTLLQGQDSILMLFLFCMAFVALASGRDRIAGGWLALGLCKFQLVLPFVLPLVWLRRKRILYGFLPTASVLLLSGLFLCGLPANLAYLRFAWRVDHDPRFYGFNLPQITTNLRGVVFSLTHASVGIDVLLAIVCLAMLFTAAKVWDRGRSLAAPSAAFAIALLAATLVSFYCHIYDWVVLALAILLALDSCIGKVMDGSASFGTSLVRFALSLFCFSPPYVIVLFRRPQWMWCLTLVPLALFLLLVWEVLRDSREARSEPTSANT